MAEKEKIYLGLDAGSVSLNTVLIKNGCVIAEDYTRIKEHTVKTAAQVLKKLFSGFDPDSVAGVGTTGSGGKLLAELLNGSFTNEIVAHTKGVEKFHPLAKTIIDIGGEDAKVIFPKQDRDLGVLLVEDFAMNTMCAAGTGSFLDQQAHRLGVSIVDEFGEMALKSKNPPRIAGRCSVFAKTDMIHLQQEGTPDYDIIAGLCFALARTFKSNICKGRDPEPPVVFQGGVAANKGMARAVRETFKLEGDELIIPDRHASMGAIGAALLLTGEKEFKGFAGLEEYMKNYRQAPPGLEPLSDAGSSGRKLKSKQKSSEEIQPATGAYVGIDVGSLSTNVVVIDEQSNLLARKYLPTAGRPIEAVRRGIKEIGEEIGSLLDVKGVGTTGSGRYLIGDFVGADTVKNEITAQATASIFIDPTVDTIFEIGGQDSKYISVEDGVVVDFEMNKVCAAGTGSFLEEQAERLNLSIKEEFGARALSSKNPVPLGERCTVFMESDIVSHQQQLAETEDLVAGLSYSIVRNYLNRVVGKRKIGDNIFFQGAVALNRGVVAAFKQVTGKDITVPPNNDVTGAIGVAILAGEAAAGRDGSNFKGWEKIAGAKYELRSFECRDCPNHCEIREIITEGSATSYYGSRCEKYDTDKTKKAEDKKIPDLFREREKLLTADYGAGKPSADGEKKKIGVPRALYTYEMLPFWKSFLENLGFELVFSDKTNRSIISDGIDTVAAETCFPVKVAHGHIKNLLEKEIDFLFLPMVVNMKKKSPGTDQSAACPYVQALPYMAKAAFDFEDKNIKVLSPTVAFGWGERLARKGLLELGRDLGKSSAEIIRAAGEADRAQDKFYETLRARGEKFLNSLPEGMVPVVIVSRPYNGCDNGVNLNLPQKLRSLGAIPIPMDCLPHDDVDLSKEWPSMYWRYGQKILGAADIIRKDDRLQCLYITNFGCGPDSFITQFFREKMTGKPYLEIEVDEHSADVGAITRCEAFLDSIKSAKKALPMIKDNPAFISPTSHKKRKLYIPYMSDIAYALEAALKSEGIDSEVFPLSNEETLEIGRKHTCGRECYPCIITTGDMLRITRRKDFDPDRSAFFMPTAMGPCRFGQYNRLQRIILNEQGLGSVPIISPNQIRNLDGEMKAFGKNIFRKVWKGIVAVDVLGKMLRETRPYESNIGETDRVYKKCLDRVISAVENRENPARAIEASVEDFGKIPLDAPGSKPIVGIIGEIFVRSHEFANKNIVREIEALGGEVWLTPVSEWFFHINNSIKLYSRLTRKYPQLLVALLAGHIQSKDERSVAKAAQSYLRNPHDPPIGKIWENSEPYLPGWFGETALGIGKSVDYLEKGASGIINVMPFTCLPGNIASAIFKRFRKENNNIPILNMAYDGTEEANTKTRLEAYMYQVKQFRERKNS